MILDAAATAVAIVLAAAAWALFPYQVRAFVGRVLGLLSVVVSPFNRAAVALRVEGEINSAREVLVRDCPEIMLGRLRLEWCRAERAAALIRDGDVVVVMRRAQEHHENVARALMAYLPRSVLAIARPYLGLETMRAVDFTLADQVLRTAKADDARTFLRDRHLEPARKSNRTLEDRLTQVDKIDMHGWLTRVLIADYQRLGAVMYPGAQDARFTSEAEEFAAWLYKLTFPERSESLQYRGTYFKVAIVFVAASHKLLAYGLEPYRRRVVGLLYREREFFDVVHVMGRDQNIPAVRTLVQGMLADGLIAEPSLYEYDLRDDFALKSGLSRDRAVCATLRRRPGKTLHTVDDDQGLPSQTFAPVVPPAEPNPTLFPFHVEDGVIAELEPRRMFGFIQTGEERLFFHASQLVDCTLRDLKIGSRVVYRRMFDARRNKHHAENVKLLPGRGPDPQGRSK